MNLYEIEQSIMDCVDIDTGEILDSKRLDALKMERAEKVRNIALWVKNLRSDVAALKAEEESFQRRRKAAEKKLESLTTYLSGFLKGEKVKEDKFSISWRDTPASKIDDESLIPAEYWRTKEPELNRAEILRVLKAGGEVPGARLVKTPSMTIK